MFHFFFQAQLFHSLTLYLYDKSHFLIKYETYILSWLCISSFRIFRDYQISHYVGIFFWRTEFYWWHFISFYANAFSEKISGIWPIDIRLCEPSNPEERFKPRLVEDFNFQCLWSMIIYNNTSFHCILFLLRSVFIDIIFIVFSLKYWLKVRGELSDEQALHR